MTHCFDAHNHLSDPRLAPLEEIVAEMERAGIARCVVNGTCEADWPQVAAVAARYPIVKPSFGLHPWKAATRSPRWLEILRTHLDSTPGACLGECGLDRWMKEYDLADQQEIFLAQLDLAATRNLPLSIHCLQAWGPLLDALRHYPRPARGFLLHSYGGSRELVAEFAPLGAWFSFSGYFLEPRKAPVREAFRSVPLDRLLVETDAPDMLPPLAHRRHSLCSAAGDELNHPANLPGIVESLAGVLGSSPESLRTRLAANFRTFFEA